jgi:hypothetical protein
VVSAIQEDKGKTFTQYWCAAFDKFLGEGRPFNCSDIKTYINSDPKLEQFPATFVLRNGCGVPIKFMAPSYSTALTGLSNKTIITAFHIEENPDSDAMKRLVAYLKNSPVPITILATVPAASTLLVLRIPLYLQELLILPRVALVLLDA